MSTRHKEKFDSYTEERVYINTPSTCIPSSPALTYPIKSYNWSFMDGVDTPNFYKRVKRGEIMPFTYFLQVKSEGEVDGDRSNQDKITCSNDYYNFWFPGGNKWTLETGYLAKLAREYHPESARLVQAAAAAIYAQGFDLTTFLGELPESARMFRNVVSRWAGLAKTGQLAKMWLEGRYGWRSVYYDYQNVVAALKKGASGVKKKRFKKVRRDTFKLKNVVTNDLSNTYEQMDETITDDIEVNLVGTVVADIVPPDIQTNLAITSWELFTLSFVVDWVVDIGTWLEALSFLALQSDYQAGGGVEVKVRREYVVNGQDKPGSYYYSSSHAYGLANGVAQLRRPMSVPIKPFVHLNLDAFKVMDLVALFVEATKRR